MLPHGYVKAFSDIFDSVVLDKYCPTVKGASCDISYLIYLKFFWQILPHSYRDLFSYLIWRGPLLGSNLNIYHIPDIASPLAIFRCLCQICNFCQKLPFSPNSPISPKSPLFMGSLFASRRGLHRILTTYYNRKSDLIIKRFAYVRFRSYKKQYSISLEVVHLFSSTFSSLFSWSWHMTFHWVLLLQGQI